MDEEILNRRWYERATALLAEAEDLHAEAAELINIALQHYVKFCNGYD